MAVFNHYTLNERPESQESAIELLEKLGWKYLSPKDAEVQRGSLTNVILKDDLIQFLKSQTYSYKGQQYQFSSANIFKAIEDINPDVESGIHKASKEIYDMLIYGKSYEETLVDGSVSSFDLHFIDWKNPESNILRVTEEFSVEKQDKSKRRPDIVLTVNGLPLVIIECKKSSIDIKAGILQNVNNNKLTEIATLFKFAQIIIAMNPHSLKYGTCGTSAEYYIPWKEKENDWLNKKLNKYIKDRTVKEQDRGLISLLSPERFFELVRYFILYDNNIKKIARYQQYFGVQKAIKRITMQDNAGTRNGVIWHTQGSGKSLTMVMLVKKIMALSEQVESGIKNPRFVLVNDRVNLDKQLRDNFINTQMNPSRATTGEGLINLLQDDSKILITTVINKFLSVMKRDISIKGDNIFLLIDECHRTQSGHLHDFMSNTFDNAVKIGFTGTPLLREEKENTYKRIGPLIDSYTIEMAEADKVIVPLIYEGRKIPQQTTSDDINSFLDEIMVDYSKKEKEAAKKKYSKFTNLSSIESRLYCICIAIKKHFNENIKPKGFKAMVAASSRVNAIYMYHTLKSFDVKCAVVISPETQIEGDTISDIDKKKIADFFRSEIQPLYKQKYDEYEDWAKHAFIGGEDIDILIVKDKLLTGFDAPIAQALYIDKPMQTHNLLQAIARVNRVFPGKYNGRIIDFYGIFTNLNEAIDLYTDTTSGMNGFDEKDIAKAIYGPKDIVNDLAGKYNQLIALFEGLNIDDLEEIQQHFSDEGLRHEFYNKLNDYVKVLDIADGNYNFYKMIGHKKMSQYRQEFMFMQKLKRSLKVRYGENIDFNDDNGKIRDLLNKFIISGKDKVVIAPLLLSDKEALKKEIDKLPSVRAKAEAITNNLVKAISEKIETDPIAYMSFREMIDETLSEYEKYRDEEAYLLSILKIEENFEKGFVGNKYPTNIYDDSYAKGIYGKLYLNIKDIIRIDTNDKIDISLGETALKIKDVFRVSQKPGWQNNPILISKIKQDIEDYIYNFIDLYNIDLSMELLDKIEEDILITAKGLF